MNQFETKGASKTTMWRPVADRGWEAISNRVLCKDLHSECMIGWIVEDSDSDTGFSAQGNGEYMYDAAWWMKIPD